MVPHANWHHSTVRQSEHTKYSTYQQQCNGSKCSLWGMKMTTLPKLVEFSFIPYMSASVIECRSIETVSPEGTFCDTVQVPSNGGDMELI